MLTEPAAEPGENTSRQHLWAAAVVSVASAAASFLVWLQWISPVETQPMQPPDGPDYWGGSVLLFLLAPGPVIALTYRNHDWPRYLLGALVIPTVTAAVAYGVSDELRWQRQAKHVYAAYTHRFPAGRLHDLSIDDQHESSVSVCATDGTEGRFLQDARQLCLSMAMEAPVGQRVVGGYHWHYGNEATRTYYGCWGEPAQEGRCG